MNSAKIENAVDVWIEVGAAAQILLDHWSSQLGLVEFQQEEISPPMKVFVRHGHNLMSERAVNDPFLIERRGHQVSDSLSV